MRIWISRLLAVCLGLLLAFFALEVILRLFPQVLPPVVASVTGRQRTGIAGQQTGVMTGRLSFEADPELGFRPGPNQDVWPELESNALYRVRTGSRGLRGSHDASSVYGIALGDSFTFGDGVNLEDTWVYQLEKLSGVAVENFGVTRYGPQSELKMMLQEGLPLRPKLVIWQFFVNDLEDADTMARWQDSGQPSFLDWLQQEPVPVRSSDSGSLLKPVAQFLRQHVISYELIKYALGSGSTYRNWKEGAIPIKVAGETLWLIPKWQTYMLNTDRPAIENGWQITQRSLLQARSEAETAGAEFVVVIVPTKEETYWDLLDVQRKMDTGVVLPKSDALLAEFCRLHNLRCLNLYDRFAEAAQGDQALYFSRDGHWNSNGHRLAAQVIYDFLMAEGLMP